MNSFRDRIVICIYINGLELGRIFDPPVRKTLETENIPREQFSLICTSQNMKYEIGIR